MEEIDRKMDILEVVEQVNKSFSAVQNDMEVAYKRLKKLEKGQKKLAKSCFLNSFSVGILSFCVANLVAKMKNLEKELENVKNERAKNGEI